MRQVVLAAPGELRLEERPEPEPGPEELRVRAQAVGICGSDLHAYAGEHPFIDLPVVPVALPLPLVQDRELRLQGTG